MTWTIALFGFLFSMVPYLLVAWGYSELTHSDAKTFWTAFAALLVARLFFALVEWIGGMLWWHLFAKRIFARKAGEWLRANKFPMREYQHDNFSAYLCRIQEGNEYPASLKSS